MRKPVSNFFPAVLFVAQGLRIISWNQGVMFTTEKKTEKQHHSISHYKIYLLWSVLSLFISLPFLPSPPR